MHSKCKFFKTKVHYLGFLIGVNDGPLPEKVTAIKVLEPPKDINKLRQFLGLVGFYRKFIPFFTDVIACLNTMLWKGVTFQWIEQCNNAFKLLKSELPTLQYPNPNKPFKLFTDVSKQRYSGILHQEETPKMPNAEANLIPIAHFSDIFGRIQQLWNTTQKECYTLYQSIQKFAFYLTCPNCMLYCNHKSIAPFFTTGMSSPLLDRWPLELQQFGITFQHIQGKMNVVADAIS